MFFFKSESKKDFFSTYRPIFNIILVNKMDSLYWALGFNR